VVPEREYLVEILNLSEKHGALAIFDEVMTGFRIAAGGAQEHFGVRAHLTCLGKIVGGGLPIGAYGGRADIMDHIAPAGSVYQAGTLSGNPLAVTAGLKTLEILERDRPYKKLQERTEKLCRSLETNSREVGVPLQVQRCGSMFTAFFNNQPVSDFEGAKSCDTRRFGVFFNQMLERGIYLAPSQFEAGFVSAAHSEVDIERTIEAAASALHNLD